MKRIILLYLFILVAIYPAISGNLSYALKTPPASRGAANVTELATVVFTAIQANDFDQLPLYIPTDTDLNKLKKHPSEDVQAVLEDLTVENITASLKESFETVIQEGISKTLNLSELTLADVKSGSPDAKNRILIPVTATLTTRTNQALPLKFETLKINGRYFLFQRVQWQSSN